jgi:hypothetical protein
MELDLLKDRWQQRGAPEAHWKKGEDMGELRRKLGELRRTAWRRDLRETIAAVLVAALFTGVALTARQPLARVGSMIIVAAALFIIVWMRVVGGRNLEPDPGLPVVEFFRRELLYLDRQIHLLRSVFWWYIAPNLVGVTLFFVGAARSTFATAIFLMTTVGLSAAVYWLNQMAARTALVPLREEVARLLLELETNGTAG